MEPRHRLRCPKCGSFYKAPGVPLTNTQRDLFDLLLKEPINSPKELHARIPGHKSVNAVRTQLYHLNKSLVGTAFWVSTQNPYRVYKIPLPPFRKKTKFDIKLKQPATLVAKDPE